jgi:hypothetical protein
MKPGQKILHDRDGKEDSGLLKGSHEAFLHHPLGLPTRYIDPIKKDPSLSWNIDPRQEVKDGRLPRPIGTDDPDNLLGIHSEIHSVYGDEAPKMFSQI